MLDLNLNQFKENLAHFTGTEAYHKISIGKSCVTDGAKYVATELGAFWLFDAISSHIEFGDMPEQDMYFSKLTVDDSSAKLSIEDGDHNQLAQQDIEFTDFPLESIEIWSQRVDGIEGNKWIHLLPSEY